MLPAVDALAGRFRLKHFKLLKAIDDEGSLARAAENVSISQPGATKMLREIEDAIGHTMFLRTNRGLEPNEIGRCVIRYSRLMLSNLDGMHKEIVGVKDGLGGFLCIGAVMGAMPTAAKMAAQLAQKRPEVKVQIRQSTSNELLSMLDKCQIDLAICRTSVSAVPDDYTVWLEKEERVSVIANKMHPKAGLPDLELADLTEFPWIVCLPNMPMRRHFEREFINISMPFPSNVIETASALAIMVLLKTERSICTMQPEDLVEQLVACGEVTKLDVSLSTKSEPYQVVSCINRELSHTARIALEVLNEQTELCPKVGAGLIRRLVDLV